MRAERLQGLLEVRTRRPREILDAAARRRPSSLINEHGRLMVIAAGATGYEGGKMLLRIDPDDPATVATIQACAGAVSELAARRLMAMVEPFVSHRVDGRVRNDLSTEAVLRSVTVAAGLGSTSAYTWLKLPVVEDMERVLAASTLPTLLLGGEVGDGAGDQDAAFARWERALRLPTVRGLVAGRTLLYPPDDDVAAAVDTAVGLLGSAS